MALVYNRQFFLHIPLTGFFPFFSLPPPHKRIRINTMDDSRSESVLKVFVDLYNKGLIYRGVRMVNWDPAALTALSDEEVVWGNTVSEAEYPGRAGHTPGGTGCAGTCLFVGEHPGVRHSLQRKKSAAEPPEAGRARYKGQEGLI